MQLNIEMVLMKDCAMGKTGKEVVIHSQSTVDYFIEKGIAKLKTEAIDTSVASENFDDLLGDETPHKAGPKKQTSKK